MLYLYDRSLVEKFKKVFSGEVIYAPVDKFLERYLLVNDNNTVKLPALSLWRSSFTIDKTTMPTHLRIPNISYKDNSNYTEEVLFSVRFELSYQLDIWTSNDIDRDDFLRELIYYLTLDPYLVVSYRNKKFSYPVYINEVVDATDIASFENSGDLYRLTMNLQVPDARVLFYNNLSTLKYINLDINVKEK